MPKDPEFNPIHVGNRCLVTLLGTGGTFATGVDERCGMTTWFQHGETEVHVSPSYYYSQNSSGQRDDTIPTMSKDGQPVPEVAALVALLSGSQAFRFECIQLWCAQHPGKAAGYSLRAGFVECDESPAPFSDHWQHNLMSRTHRNPEFFREWVKEWYMTMVEGRRFDELNAWQRAAQRVLAVYSALENPPEEDSDPNSPLVIHSRIIKAIKSAANDCAGVPYQAAVLERLNDDGGTKLDSDQLRQRLRTLGFNWIPGHKDWKRDWAPVMEEHGW